MGSHAGVELVYQPSDRTARWPLSVRPAIAGCDLDRKIVSRRCASADSVAAEMALARSTVPIRVREESASIKGPGRRRQAQARPQGVPAAATRIPAWKARSCGCAWQ